MATKRRKPKSVRDWWCRQACIEARRGGGRLSSERLVYFAARTGLTPRHMRRIVANGGPFENQRKKFEATEEQLDEVVRCQGEIAVAYDELDDRGHALPSESTWFRAVKRQMHEVGVAEARDGHKGRLAKDVHARTAIPHRNVRWQVDWHDTKLPVRGADGELLRDANGELTHFHVLGGIDMATGALTLLEGSLEQTGDVVFSALFETFCMQGRDPELGGVPKSLGLDNGTPFTSDALTALLDHLDLAGPPNEAYSPEQNGMIERFWGTLLGRFSKSLPGYTHGPKRKDMTPHRPAEYALPIEAYEDRLQHVFEWMNHIRKMRRLGYRTSIEAWRDDPEEVRILDPSVLSGLTAPTERKVGKEGVFLKGRGHFISVRLAELGGEQVNVWELPGRNRVFASFGEKWLGPLIRQQDFSEPERQALAAARRTVSDRLAQRRQRIRRADKERAQRVSSPLDALTQVEETTSRVSDALMNVLRIDPEAEL